MAFGLINRGDLPTTVENEFENLIAGLRAFLFVAHNPDGTIKTADPSLAVVPVGAISAFGGTAAPTGYLLCDGAQVDRNFYSALFAVVGTTFGAGNGTTTFNLPDLRQRFPLGKAAAGTGSTLGVTGGAIDHTHAMSGASGSTAPGTDSQGSHGHGGSTGSGGDHSHGGATGSTGPGTGTPSGSTNLANSALGSDFSVADGNHTHSVNGHTHTISSSGSHSHTISNDGSHSHTVNSHTHAAGTLATATANPPFLSVNYIIFVGV